MFKKLIEKIMVCLGVNTGSGKGVIAKDVISLVESIQEQNLDFSVYIGGGYLRDKDHGLKPKDVDVFLVPRSNSAEQVNLPTGGYIKYKVDSKNIPAMCKRGISKVFGLHVDNLSTKEVQLIVYNKYLSHLELTKDMDMNINQIMYCTSNKETLYSEEYVCGHDSKTIKCLKEFDKDRKQKRFTRMKLKFPKYKIVGDDLFKDEDFSSTKIKNMKSSKISFID